MRENNAWLQQQKLALASLRRNKAVGISTGLTLTPGDSSRQGMATFQPGRFYGPLEHAIANVPLLFSYGQGDFFYYDDKTGGGMHVDGLTVTSESDEETVTYDGVIYRASVVARPCTGIPVWRTCRALGHQAPMQCAVVDLINLLEKRRPEKIDVAPLPEETNW